MPVVPVDLAAPNRRRGSVEAVDEDKASRPTPGVVVAKALSGSSEVRRVDGRREVDCQSRDLMSVRFSRRELRKPARTFWVPSAAVSSWPAASFRLPRRDLPNERLDMPSDSFDGFVAFALVLVDSEPGQPRASAARSGSTVSERLLVDKEVPGRVVGGRGCKVASPKGPPPAAAAAEEVDASDVEDGLSPKGFVSNSGNDRSASSWASRLGYFEARLRELALSDAGNGGNGAEAPGCALSWVRTDALLLLLRPMRDPNGELERDGGRCGSS